MKHQVGDPDAYQCYACVCGKVFLNLRLARVHITKANAKDHCRECRFWVVFYTNSIGKDIWGCRVGTKPENKSNEPFCQWRRAEESNGKH